MRTVNKFSYQLSPMQQGMLFEHLKSEGAGMNIEQMICSLHEALNVLTFTQAWQRVVERHPILRSSFDWQDLDEPLQTVHPQVQLPLEQQDWCYLSASEQEDKLQAYLQADRERGFDLSGATLIRLSLFQLAESDYKLVWTFHHILLDGRSFQILLKEVFAFYEAFCQGEDLQLEQPRLYSDYIGLQQQDVSKAEAFLRQMLSGFTAPTPLVVERVTRGGHSQELGHGQEQLQFSKTVTSALKSLAQEHELTLNTLVNGAWALLLSRYSGEEDVVFGATRACRQSALQGTESMVGLFINTLPLRVQVSPELSVLSWLKELRSQWIALRDYEHTPLVQVQKWSDISPGISLFESIVVFENYQLNSVLYEQGDSWEKREFQLLEQTSFPLTVSGYAGQQLLLKIEYDYQRFEQATIIRMLGHLQTLLESMVANPEQCLADLPILTQAERHQLLVKWNDTRTEYPYNKCIHQLFEAQVERTPDAVAVVFEDQQLTYRELNSRANQLAHHLQTLGVRTEVLVGICVERSLEMIVGLLAVLKAGGAYVPIDPAYPKECLVHLLSDSQVLVLLTQENLLPKLPDRRARVICLDTDWGVISAHSQENPVSGVQPENLAYAIYTSGSTGLPKGVTIQHGSVLNLLAGLNRAIYSDYQDSQLRVSVNGSIAFDTSVKQIIQLLQGHTLDIVPGAIRFDGDALLSYLGHHQVDVFDCTPSQLGLLISAGLLTQSESVPQCVLVGGEPINPSTWRVLAKAEYTHFYNVYGPTECTVDTTVCHLQMAGDLPVIGRPIANTQIYILDRHLQPVPIGVPGELHIGGAGLARGYLNRSELTAEKFILNPFSDEPGNRLYKTGDLVCYLPDGNIEYLGRIDNQVKIRGFRIELGEIEAVLAQDPAVRETVVIAREDHLGDKRLVAYVIPHSDRVPAASELRSFLKEKLPDYMVPSAFVTLDAIPLTPNGKVDRRALPAPDWEQRDLEEIFVAPRTPIEESLADIWSQVLGVKQIGVKDNFFDLGGHSLLAIRLVAEIEKAVNIKVPLAALFQFTTVEQMARFVQDENSSTGASKQEQFLDLPTATEFSNNFPQEYSGFTLEEYKKLLTIVAGRKGKRPRQNSLMVAIREQGNKPPLFMCASAVKEVFSLAKNLDKEQPFYFLESGFTVIGNVEDKIKAIAAHHVKDILLIQPEPPYLLCGYSFGTVLIDEIAQQLLAKGKQVSLVVMLDKYGDQLTYRLYNKLVWVLTYHLHHSASLSFIEKLQYIQKNLKLFIFNKFQKSTEREKSQPPYTSYAYPGKVILFCSIPNKHDSVPPDRLIPIISSKFTLLFFRRAGWDQRVKPDLKIITVPGDHISMQEEPHVKVLAEKLQVYLDRAVIKTEQKNLSDSAPAS